MPRLPDEGVRIGTVRRPPRGVAKRDYARGDWFDVWFPNLAPSPATVALGRGATTERERAAFRRRYRKEMSTADNARTLDVLAALSRNANFSVGCYCEEGANCHRSELRALMAERGASIA